VYTYWGQVSSLLSRRHECTRVYTTVYPRVHNSVHACTLLRSKYLPYGALYDTFPGAKPRYSERYG